MSSLQHYLRRIRETPVSMVLHIIWSRTTPYVYAPLYAAQKALRPAVSVSAFQSDVDQLRALGKSMAARLLGYAAQDPQFAERARRRAETALAGRVPCLGYGTVDVPRGKGWLADSFHGYTWEQNYFPRIDYPALAHHCDVKVPWEISRLQYLVWLAEGALFAPQDARVYREKFLEIVVDWNAANPPGYGVNWTCAMEVAIRAINLSVAFAIFAEALDDRPAAMIARMLRDHVVFVERFPEISDITGNHYLADLAGVAFVRQMLLPVQPADASQALEKFCAEAARQFEPEGCQIEGAPMYHRMCLEMVGAVAAIAMRRDAPQRARLIDIVARGVQFCATIAGSDGRLPVFGDCDSGQILSLQPDARDYGGMRRYAAALAGEGVELGPDDLAYWLAAISDLDVGATQSGIAPSTSATAERSNRYVRARFGDLAAVMRVGPQGLHGRAGHDHDDALSVWISKAGRDVFVEEGTYAYTLDAARRAQYILSTAHNLVQPAGGARVRPGLGSLVQSIRGAPTAADWSASASADRSAFSASLDTTSARQPFKAHERSVLLTSPKELVISDVWAWREPMAATVLWHFGPGFNISGMADMRAQVSDAGMRFSLTVESVVSAQLSTFAFKYSPAYGSEIDCVGLRIDFPNHSENKMTTAVSFA